MRVLITGGFGFVGRHLATHLVKCGDDVAITYLPGVESLQDLENSSKGIKVPRVVQTLALDVTNRQQVEQIIKLTKPDIVYHLAAISSVPQGEAEILKVFDANLNGTLYLLEAIHTHSPNSRFLFISSSEVYGDPVPGSLPLTENSVLRPISIYGVTKAAADLATYKYAYREGVYAVRVRAFPHTGPGQGSQFAISSFAKQIAEIKLGKREPKILVGNLEAKRDYSDVSDIIRGYREAILNGKKGDVYNLCSGKSTAISSLLEKLIEIAGVKAEIVVDPSRYRSIDIPDSFGSSDKAYKEFGWKPRIDLEGTLHSLFAYWLESLDT